MSVDRIDKPGNEKVKTKINGMKSQQWWDAWIVTRKEIYTRIRGAKFSEYYFDI
jgi:hypothetical protein